MDLFSHNQNPKEMPLAERLRPQSFAELVGQESLFRKNPNLFSRLQKGNLQSLILWGPPGCGKTSFAKAVINEVQAQVFEENAVDLGVKRIRELGEAAKSRLFEQNQKTVVFIDEIHRLNRGQQDVLLPYVERGHFYLIGATTENPSYQLNSALMSRCRLLEFEPLSHLDLKKILAHALEKQQLRVEDLLGPEAIQSLIEASHGDGRKILNLAEEVIYCFQNQLSGPFPLTEESLKTLFQSSGLRFDKKGDEHYDTISAFIKSLRGSDPDAAIYYLVRMLEGGEDPLFIARRLVILASEDVGNADPQALGVAVNGLHAIELVGLPEAQITLAQMVTYLACAPKSNRSYMALRSAQEVVQKSGPLPVPKSLRSAQTRLMKSLGYGEGYQYSHDGDKGYIQQDFLPEPLKNQRFYEPSGRGFEKRMAEYQKWVRGDRAITEKKED
ncbi:MAG: replication-associated recombination protein A [Bdellovibrionales bacterium]|nr:replication-associated recombination protein A [Bdellovibrionales bacterium]